MAPKYELLPTSPSPSRPESPMYPPPYDGDSHFDNDVEDDAAVRRPRLRREPISAFDSDPRFRVRTPSPFARAALLIFLAFLFWLAFSMRKALWIEGGMGMSKVPPPEVDPSY